MYLLVIDVPSRRRVSGLAEVVSDWGCSLALLRDSFGGRLGKTMVAAPQLPPGDGFVARHFHLPADYLRRWLEFERGRNRWMFSALEIRGPLLVMRRSALDVAVEYQRACRKWT